MPKDTPATEPARDPLDHDGDGLKGGIHPAPETTYLVVIKDDEKRGLSHGQVIGTADQHVKTLLAAHVARNATDEEVELARPRVALWSPPAA